MSKARKYTDVQLSEAVKTSFSVRDILQKLGKSTQGGGSYYQIYDDINRLNLDKSHFTGSGHLKGKTHNWTKSLPLEQVLVENSLYSRGSVKKRLLKNGMLKKICSVCGQINMWYEQTLVMVLDHINGIYNDHRLENLRMLCPNCNSQQKTFCGRNRKCNGQISIREKKPQHKLPWVPKKCECCGKDVLCKKAKRFCSQLCSRLGTRNVERPSWEVLQQDIATLPMTKIGKKYGVSDNAVRKWIRQYDPMFLCAREKSHNTLLSAIPVVQ